MKRLLIISILALLGMSQLAAQEYEYVPFVREGVKWVYYYDNPVSGINYGDIFLPYGEHFYTFEMHGDTIINGKSYKPIHLYSGTFIDYDNDIIPVLLREEDQVVYGIIPDGKRYFECPIGIGTSVFNLQLHSTIKTGVEFVLYDFNDPSAFYDAYRPSQLCGRYQYNYSDTIQIGDHLSKRQVVNYISGYNGRVYDADSIIEGIGFVGKSPGTPLNYFTPAHYTNDKNIAYSPNQVFYRLSHVIDNGEIVYKSEYYHEPNPIDENDDYYIPYITEGVKFVNEKVIVNNCDTTSYYYTYEMTPGDVFNDGVVGNHNSVMWCHYYTGSGIDVLNDSIICGIYHCIAPGEFNAFHNKAFSKVVDEHRNLIFPVGFMSPEYELYDPLYDYFIFNPYTFERFTRYLEVLYDIPFLTTDNFYEVEPTTVNGLQMQRYAYFNEQGDTLAYVVQGIGFDSRDMGDLLTPFTRRPDPDADYQEWCGLSHVIKDGKIIYKGMRYREGAFDGISEVVADRTRRPVDPHYYNLMGQPVGTTVPSTPGIYIHQGRKICVSRMP